MTTYGAQTIVVLDDDLLTLKLVRRLLRGTDLELHCCTEPDECTELLASVRPDKIFVDQRLPGTSGVQYCEYLHGHAPLTNTEKFLWSAAELPDDTVALAERLQVNLLSKDVLRSRTSFMQVLAA